MSSSDSEYEGSLPIEHSDGHVASSKAKSRMEGVAPANGSGKNEDWEYKPPPGFTLMDHDVDVGKFDWDALKDDENLELWVIRMPKGLQAKHLENVKLDVPSSSRTTRVGSIGGKSTAYDVWSLGDGPADVVGGEELKSLSCLLPRKRKGGRLYQAPRPIARHLVITAKPVLPTLEAPEASSSSSAPMYKNPPRPRYPSEVLTHRFMPIGSLSSANARLDSMDVDQVEDSSVSPSTQGRPSADVSATAGELPKKRKRKGESSRVKTSRKTKTAA